MADTDQVKVVIRVRPLIQRERQAGYDASWNVADEKVIRQRDQPTLPPYIFDQIYDRDSTTWDLYSGIIAPIVDAAMNGYHGTVFAYGQSGSGKTHTMSGNKTEIGIIAQAMTDIFNFIEKKPSHEFLMRASYMEIYNEKIYDLFTKEDKHLKLQETPDHQINVVGLEEKLVSTCQQVLDIIQSGEAQRTFAETKQNDRSSRSHCIFRIIIESRSRGEVNGAVMVSHLNFVDLAGSEKAGENSGDRLREGCSINKSLFSLSNVISKLSEGVSNQFIGYRDSKLTRILQNALGGNSKTVIVATINPTAIEESHSTLRFATRAKTIKNKPHVNEVLSEAALLKKYRNEINRLERLVNDMGVADIQSTNEDLKKRLEEKQQLISQLTQQIVVSSSLSDPGVVTKKKMRRETWCAPKVQRLGSFFPSLKPMDFSHVSIREEMPCDLDMVQKENLDIPFTEISASLQESKAKEFLRRSDEMELSVSIFGKSEDKGHRVSDSNDEVERLEGVIRAMETEHAEEVEKMQEQLKQLQFERAVEADQQEEKEKTLTSNRQQEVTTLTQEMDKVKYELQLSLEENKLLQSRLWLAEEDNKRLKQETKHLCNKRFNISLKDWEQLENTKISLEADIRQLEANLQDRDKEVEALKRELAGQDPYIVRLEQQLEMYMGAGNGQLGSGSRRRSGIPVPVKANRDSNVGTADQDTQAASSEEAVEGSSSVQNQSTPPENKDEEPSTPQSQPTVDPAADGTALDKTASDEPQTSLQSDPPTDSEAQEETSSMADVSVTKELSMPTLTSRESTSNLTFQEWNTSALNSQEGASTLTTHELNTSTLTSRTSVSALAESPASVLHAGEHLGEAMGTASPLSAKLTPTQLATRLRRRSDELVSLPVDADCELSNRLREREAKIEQLSREKAQMLEVLNQTNAELVRNKEVMRVMEDADSERMEELQEVPRLRSLLNRRNMEIQQLEATNARLKEELTQHALNSSASSLSSSFSAPQHSSRRKSSMLRERDAELWTLKDKLVQQARRLEDVEQKLAEEKGQQSLPADGEDDVLTEGGEEIEASNANKTSSVSSDSDLLLPPALNVSAMRGVDDGDDETGEEVAADEEMADEEGEDQVIVTSEELKTVQRLLVSKDTLISGLRAQLVEKELEMEQMLDGKMLIPTDLIDSHLQGQHSAISQQKGATLNDELALSTEMEQTQNVAAACSNQRDESDDKAQELTARVEELDNALEKTQAVLDECKSQRDESDAKVQELTARVEELNNALDKTQAMPEECRNQRDESDDKAQELASRVEELNNTLEKTQAMLDECRNQRDESDAKVQELTARVEVLNSALEKTQAMPDDYRNQDESDHKAQELTARVEELDNALEKTQAVLDECRNQRDESDAKVQELTSRVEELGNALERTQAILDDYKNQRDESDAKVQELTSRVEELNNASEKTQALPEDCRNQRDESDDKAQELTSRVEELDNALEKTHAMLDDYRNQRDESDAKVQELTSKVEELNNALEKTQAMPKDCRNERDESDAKVQGLTSRIEDLNTVLEQTRSMLSVCTNQRDESDDRVQELISKTDELSVLLKQAQEEKDELTTELNWQTKTSEELQSRIDELEGENGEAEELLKELEKTQKLLEDSEQCQKYMEETLEEFKVQNQQLEGAKVTLATERDEFELREEAARKEQDRLRLELKITEDRLQAKVANLELELETAGQRKEVLEAALADRKSAQHMGELLHEKLSADLQESQAEVVSVKTALSQLQSALQGQESKISGLQKVRDGLQAERDQLLEVKAELEAERTDLKVKLMSVEKSVESLQKDLADSQEVAKAKAAAVVEVTKCNREMEILQEQVHRLQQQAEGAISQNALLQSQRDSATAQCQRLKEKVFELESQGDESTAQRQQLKQKVSELESQRDESTAQCQQLGQKVSMLQSELDSATAECKQLRQVSMLPAKQDNVNTECQHLTEKVSMLESRCRLAEERCQDANASLKQLQEEAKKERTAVQSEKSHLQNELGAKLEDIERLQMELEAARSATDSLTAEGGEKMVPLLEHKKQKFVLKTKIRHLSQNIDMLKEGWKLLEDQIKEKQEKLEKYENDEQEDKRMKLEELQNSLKGKEMELVSQKMHHQRELSQLKRQLSNAEEMVAYKEKMLDKLKLDIRRYQAEEVSFCAPSKSRSRASAPDGDRNTRPDAGSGDERVISSYSGVIDRYTVTLLEADKHKLQKELKKTQERLKSRESELHLTKVILAKVKTGQSSSTSPTRVSSAALSTSVSEGEIGVGEPVANLPEKPLSSVQKYEPVPADGSMVDQRPLADTVLRQKDHSSLLPDSRLSYGTSVDMKKDRPLLPSAVDKENTPYAGHVLSAPKPASLSEPGVVSGDESPINIDPEFWKKMGQPPSMYIPSSQRLRGKSKADSGVNQCQTQ